MRMSKPLNSLLWIAGGLLASILLVVFLKQQQEARCTDVVVSLAEGSGGVTLNEQSVMLHLTAFGDSIKGMRTRDVDLIRVRHHLLQLPYIADADLYFSLRGVLNARIYPRGVVARIYDNLGHSALLADDGLLMQVTPDGGPRVPVASGMITDTLRHLIGHNITHTNTGSVLNDVYKTALFIMQEPFYKALIGQIYVNSGQELELIPVVSDQVILLGTADNLEYKFHKLMAFYRKGTIRTGWDQYKTINLKHSNQVICTNR
jgi:cell division protein FtsQ